MQQEARVCVGSRMQSSTVAGLVRVELGPHWVYL